MAATGFFPGSFLYCGGWGVEGFVVGGDKKADALRSFFGKFANVSGLFYKIPITLLYIF